MPVQPQELIETAASSRNSAVAATLFISALQTHGRASFRATGLSMVPCICPGDLVTVIKKPIEKILPGEIVLYQRDQRFCAHRVIQKIATGTPRLVTRGDCLPSADEPISAEHLLGWVMRVKHTDRWLQFRLLLKPGFLVPALKSWVNRRWLGIFNAAFSRGWRDVR